MTGVLHGEHVQVLGISVSGPAPIGWAHLQLHNDLTVLYGRNGAGKTRLLEAARDAAAGVARPDSWGIVHLRVNPALPSNIDRWASELEGAIHRRVDTVADRSFATLGRGERLSDTFGNLPNSDTPPQIPVVGAGHLIWGLLAAQIALSGEGDLENDEEALVEVANGGYLSALASGTREAPRWTVFAALHPTMSCYPEYVEEYKERQELVLSLRRRVRDARSSRDQSAAERVKESIFSELDALAKKYDELETRDWKWADLSPFGDCPAVSSVAHPAGGASDGSAWPAWTPLPFLRIADIDRLPFRFVSLADDDDQLSRQTVNLLLEQTGGNLGIAAAFGDAPAFEYSDILRVTRERLTREATLVYSLFAGDAVGEQAPDVDEKLIINMGDMARWMRGETPRWMFRERAASPALEISDLSGAQQRWARHAVSLAIQSISDDDIPGIGFIDEPEDGMHRGLEVRLPEILQAVSVRSRIALICATHAAPLLSTSTAAVAHVLNDRSRVTVRDLTYDISTDRDELERTMMELDVDRATLLQMTRTFVIVEGPQDKIVLSKYMAERMRQASARFIYAGGAEHVRATLSSEFVLSYTDANLVIVMDNVDPGQTSSVWNESVSLARTGRTQAAKKSLKKLLELPGWEPEPMYHALDDALSRGIWHRVTPAPMSKPDVICYLPAEQFVEGQSWESLIAEWRADYRPQRPKNLKGWIQRKYEIIVDNKLLDGMHESVQPHPDIENLIRTACR